MYLKRFSVVTAALGIAAFVAVSLPADAALVLNPAQPITHTLTVQPIVLSNDTGTQTAEFFGDATQQASIEGLIDQIMAQAGIDVNWLTPNSWNNTDAYAGNIGLDTVVSNGDSAGVDSDDPAVLNLYFVEGIQAFGGAVFNEDTAAGFAKVDGNGITQYVGSNLLDFTAGLELIAAVASHELVHNLGVFHNASPGIDFNLMNDAADRADQGGLSQPGEELNATQIASILNSPLLVVIPEPTSLAIFGLAAGLVFTRKRRQAA